MNHRQQIIQRAVRIVGAPRWGGGVHREHLAQLMGFPDAWDKEFRLALVIAYRRGLLSFCGQWVVATVAHAEKPAVHEEPVPEPPRTPITPML